MKRSLLCVAALAAAAGAAQADITFSFTNFTQAGFSFAQLVGGVQPLVTGSLTGIDINAVLNASVSDTWADDLTVYVDPAPLSGGGLLQAGGFSSLGAAERIFWANGGSDLPGTTVIDAVTLATPIAFGGTVADPIIWLGNGYGGSGTSGTWSGSVTLRGVSAIPAPGAAALMGVGAIVGLRRRRR